MKKILNIYCDASGDGNQNDDIGIGVLFIENEKEKFLQMRTNVKHISEYLKISNYDDYTSGITEAFGMLFSLKNIKKKYDKIIIYTDNIQNFYILNDIKKTNTKELRKTHQTIINECDKLIKKNNVEIRWIKGHCGVYGNEVADRLSNASRKRQKYHPNLFKSKRKLKYRIIKNIENKNYDN